VFLFPIITPTQAPHQALSWLAYVATPTAPLSRRVALLRNALVYGVSGGLLLVVLRLTEYRYLVIEHSIEIYGGLVAALFSAVGIWLGITLTHKKPEVIVKEVPVPVPVPTPVPMPLAGPFACDTAKQRELGITPRELEILGLIADGLSNREIAEKLFVSENTVKTHSRRLFDKLGAQRRTQAVQLGKTARLIP
jgi:two-component system, NarL family, response regulator LiaR